MKPVKGIPSIASLIYLLPLMFLCGTAAMYFLYQGKLEFAELVREQAIQTEADNRVAVVNTQVRQLRAQVIETGELLLRQLPLPLDQVPLIVLRELGQDMARRATPWGEVFVVSLDTGARQFHYEAREFQTNLLLLATQGDSVGPQAIRTDSGIEFFIAEPLSNSRWVAVALVRSAALEAPLAQGLAGVGQIVLEQMEGTAEGMVLYTVGDAPADTPVLRPTAVRDWQLTFAPSQAFLVRSSGTARVPLILIYVFSVGFVLSLGVVGWTFYQQGRHPAPVDRAAEDAKDEEEIAPPLRRKPVSVKPKKAGKEKADPREQESREPEEDPDAAEAEAPVEDDFQPLAAEQIPAKVFRANDIRGLAEEQISEDFARHLGRCFAIMVRESGADRVFLGRDARTTSESLSGALAQGLSESGCHVVNIGLCATPLLAWTMKHYEATAAIMVTASHNPPEYNGFKLMLGGTTLHAEGIRKLRESMVRAKFRLAEAEVARIDPIDDYIKALELDIAPLKGIKVVVDAANGSAGPLAVKALTALGCTVDPLYCEPDGSFPNHQPDPSRPENLQDLCERVKTVKAHLGIALDGDGDRAVAVSEDGTIMDPDQLMMLFAEQVLTLNPAANIVSDVKSSRTLTDFIEQLGGRSLLCRSGRSFVQSAFKESGAMLAGEYSSHYFFGDRWIGFDDGIYAASRLLEILVLYNRPCSEILTGLPKQLGTPEIIVKVPDEDKFAIVQRFIDTARFPGAKLLEVDGIRVEYPEGWGLVRASNTSSALTLRFEARTEAALQKIQSMFREQLSTAAPDLSLEF